MIKETDKVVSLLNDKNNVEDKLMFLSLYNEFYNMLFNGKYGDSSYDYYERKFDAATDRLIKSFKNEKTYNDTSLMDEIIRYFAYAVDGAIYEFKIGEVKKYKKDIEEIKDTKKHISIIDEYDISLNDKANIALTVDEYARFSKNACLDIYNEEFANSLSESIYENICDKLPEFIEDNKDLHDMELYNKLNRYLKYTTKDYLAEKYLNNEIDFLSEINDFSNENIMPKYKETDRAIASSFIIFATAGFDNKNRNETKEIRKEIAELANTSTFGAMKYAYKTAGKTGKTLIKTIFGK